MQQQAADETEVEESPPSESTIAGRTLEEHQNQAGEADPSAKPFDAQEYIRQVVSDAIAPYTERITVLEQAVQDLNNIVGQPEGAVEFYTPPVLSPAMQKIIRENDDVPEYRSAEESSPGDGTPWYR